MNVEKQKLPIFLVGDFSVCPIDVIKPCDQINLGEKWFVCFKITVQGSQGRNSSKAGAWRQEPEQKCGRELLTDLLSVLHSGFLYSLGLLLQGCHCPRWSGTSQLNPHSRKMPPWACLKLMWWKGLLNWGFLFPDEPCLSQDDETLIRVENKMVYPCGPTVSVSFWENNYSMAH